MTMRTSTPYGTVTANPDQDGRRAAATVDDDVVSRAEHEAKVEELSKRLSGKDKAYQKEREKQQTEIDTLKSQVAALLQTRDPVELPELPANDPVTKHLQHIYANQREWQESLQAKDLRERTEARMRDAITKAVSDGVPLDEIDDTSPDTVATSAAAYLKDKELSDLKAKLAKLTDDREHDNTRVRQELGATTVATATGGAAPQASVDDQIRLVLAEMEQFKRDQKPQMVLRARAAISLLQTWKQRGNTAPMPIGWVP